MTVIGIVLGVAALVVGIVAGMVMFGKPQSAVPEAEQVHSVDKSSLKTLQKSRVSLMPVYDEKMLPEKDLQDLLAFLLGGGK